MGFDQRVFEVPPGIRAGSSGAVRYRGCAGARDGLATLRSIVGLASFARLPGVSCPAAGRRGAR